MTPSAQLPLPLQLRDASSFASWEAGDNQPIVDGLRGLARARKGQLFLWGQPGSGRSHLLEAVVREALDRQEQVSMLAGTELPDLPPSLLEGLQARARLTSTLSWRSLAKSREAGSTRTCR